MGGLQAGLSKEMEDGVQSLVDVVLVTLLAAMQIRKMFRKFEDDLVRLFDRLHDGFRTFHRHDLTVGFNWKEGASSGSRSRLVLKVRVRLTHGWPHFGLYGESEQYVQQVVVRVVLLVVVHMCMLLPTHHHTKVPD